MSSKADLHRKLNEIGYELGSFTSKDTLSNIIRLHSFVLRDKNINVAELNDLELRKYLSRHGFLVGPVTNQTRTIYQRKLLEALTNEKTEGEDYEIDESTLDNNDENSLYPSLSDENRFYPNLSGSYGLRNTYDEPIIIRHDYKATTSSRDRNLYDNSNEIRPRILTRTNEQHSMKINKDSTPKKINDNDKQQVTKKSGGTSFYASITIVVALIVFILYFWFVK